MAASMVIEDEWGIYTKVLHPHNGYYAGDFSSALPTPNTAGVAEESVIAAWDAGRWLGPWTR